jgi:hypothetical protein
MTHAFQEGSRVGFSHTPSPQNDELTACLMLAGHKQTVTESDKGGYLAAGWRL